MVRFVVLTRNLSNFLNIAWSTLIKFRMTLSMVCRQKRRLPPNQKRKEAEAKKKMDDAIAAERAALGITPYVSFGAIDYGFPGKILI
mgnify:CR=1 FL=1